VLGALRQETLRCRCRQLPPVRSKLRGALNRTNAAQRGDKARVDQSLTAARSRRHVAPVVARKSSLTSSPSRLSVISENSTSTKGCWPLNAHLADM
jgi:hypothetical protein